MKKDFIKNIQIYFLEYLTILMGVVGNFAPYIQAYKIFTLQSAYAVSLWASFVSFASMVCWMVYGVKKKVQPLIVANIFGLIGTFLVLLGIYWWG